MLHTARVGLVGNQLRFGCEDAHVVNDEVVSVIGGRHIEYTHAEVIVLFLGVNREVNLSPLVRRSDIAGHVGRDIRPVDVVVRTLYREQEVRLCLSGLVARVAYVAREEQSLSLAEVGLQVECGYLTGRRHTVTINHVSVGRAAVLLHLMPVGRIRDTVDDAVLTEVWEVGFRVATVVRQIVILGIAVAVRGIGPGQRVRIYRIVASGFVVVEVQSLQHLVVLLDIVFRNNSLGLAVVLLLHQWTIHGRVVINHHVAADIKPIVAVSGMLRIRISYGAGCGRILATGTQAVVDRIGVVSRGNTRASVYAQEVIALGNRQKALGIGSFDWIIDIPVGGSIPSDAPDHRILAGVIPSAGFPVVVAQVIAK